MSNWMEFPAFWGGENTKMKPPPSIVLNWLSSVVINLLNRISWKTFIISCCGLNLLFEDVFFLERQRLPNQKARGRCLVFRSLE